MPKQSLEDARGPIVQDQVELERLPLKLKTEWNTSAPISQIPDEILVEVFEAARKVLKFRAWYQLLGLCSHFRNVAIGSPTLWRKPLTSSHELTVLMLARSKDASLEIVIRDYTSWETVVCLSNHMERTKILDILQATASLSRTGECLLDPHREFSRLAALSFRPIHRDNAIPPPLIPFCHPRGLRDIDLAKVSLDWKMFPFPHLIVLRLSNIRWTHTAQISAHQLLQTLGQMPHLTSIYLSSVPIALEGITMAGNMADLPQLLHLQIHGMTPRPIQYLLSHMSLPLLQDISINCYDSPDIIDGDCRMLVESIFFVITNGSFGPFESLTSRGYDFELRTLPRYLSSNSVWAQYSFWSQNAHSDNSSIIDDLVHANSACHILEHVKRLNLDHLARGCTIPKLLSLWDVTICTDIINVYGNLFPLFTKAFAARQPPDMPLPKLRRIILVNYYHDFHERQEPGILKMFRDTLMLRRDCGIPLHTICFAACTINEDDLVDFREVVGNVESI